MPIKSRPPWVRSAGANVRCAVSLFCWWWWLAGLESARACQPDAKNFPGAEPSNGSKPLTFYPCGLIARSMFNDQFMVYSNEKPTPKLIKWKNKQIAWPSDMESKFKPKDCDWMQKNCANRVVDCEDTATKTQLAPTIYYEVNRTSQSRALPATADCT